MSKEEKSILIKLTNDELIMAVEPIKNAKETIQEVFNTLSVDEDMCMVMLQAIINSGNREAIKTLKEMWQDAIIVSNQIEKGDMPS